MLALAIMTAGCPLPAGRTLGDGREGRPLRSLGIFYGWPSLVNGASDVAAAAAELGRYDVLVLGWGLQQPQHPDHQRTRRIVAAIRDRSEVFGYIPLGTRIPLDLAAIQRHARAWQRMGARGIFFDEAGYDYGNTRRRQNQAFAAAHAMGLAAFANAWRPEQIFDAAPEPDFNPDGLPCGLRRGDAYLYESFGIVEGRAEPADERARKLRSLRPASALGVRVFAITTSKTLADFGDSTWREVVGLARAAGLDGVGWGAPNFGASDNIAPYRAISRRHRAPGTAHP